MKQDIGHFYKDQFKNYEVAPSGDAFKLIRERWEQQHQRRIYKKRILVSAGCVAFVAALFLVFHWLSGSAKKSLPQKNPSEAISVQAFQDTVVIAKQEMLKSIQSELADIKINTVSTEKT